MSAGNQTDQTDQSLRSFLPTPEPRPNTKAWRDDRRVVIIGAGPGGMAAAIRLRQAGFDNITILEKAEGLGGTWWHNRYPGAAVDVRSNLYSFSFAPKFDWTRPYVTQPELLRYFNDIADKYNLRSIIHFGTEVRSATWNDDLHRWNIVCANGDSYDADFVVSAIGMFNELHMPEIDGLDTFTGTMFHSARWNHDHDLTGERVGVIGSAASAVQFVPEIAGQVTQLQVFQRSANWVAPKDDVPYTEAEIAEHVKEPEALLKEREAEWHRVESFITFNRPHVLQLMEKTVREALEVVEDPKVRAALTPTVPYGSHRPLISSDYYVTFNRPNVELVTDPIVRVEKMGIVTADGTTRTVDTIILATGFQTTRYLSAIDVVGGDGVSISDAWKSGAYAYLGITTPGFPNLFMLYGPNTNNGSILYMIECQIDYVVRHLQQMESDGRSVSDVRSDSCAAYNDQLQREIDAVEVWRHHQKGYYRGESGQIVTQWPLDMARYRAATTTDDRDMYTFL